ncbi:MAG: hypothetical protein AABX52_01810 [Nanoarchaeota archaeon]
MAQETKPSILQDSSDEYEILPHKEIHELREQLTRLKEKPTERTLQLALCEVSTKMDRLINIFEEALTMVKVEEGSLSFTEKLRPLMEKMDKILEQNSEIAAGIVGLHDFMVEVKTAVDQAIATKKEDRFTSPFETTLPFPGSAVPTPQSAQARQAPVFPPPPQRR